MTELNFEVLPPLGHINLRGDPHNEKFLSAVADALGDHLPLAANTMTAGDRRIYWLGPDEWLIVTALQESAGLLEKLRGALSGQHAAVTEVSGGQVVMRLAGAAAREVLAKGCTIDFHPRAFDAGHCAQTGLAKANALIGLIDSSPTFEIIVRRSFADYVGRWLRHAARESATST